MALNKALGGPFNSTQINTSTTTQVATAASDVSNTLILKRVVVGVAGASSPTITIYDNTTTTGTPIFSCSGGTAISLDCDIRCELGIRVVTATGTPGTYYIIWG